MPYDCFISYSSLDLKYAEELNEKLFQQGFKVWFDKIRLQPGYNWHHEIEAGCESSRVLLPVLTSNWKKSDWTKFETYGAESVIPLIVSGSWDEVKTPPLERYQAEMLIFSDMEQGDWDRLYAYIKNFLTQTLPEKERRIVSLRYRPNVFFVGRETDLILIHEEFHTRPKAALTQGRVCVITGSGGFGKTTLVRQYAEKFWRCYMQMIWVDARLNLESEFANVHDLLFPEMSTAGLPDKEKAELALRELNSFTVRLLIIDNVEDEKSIRNWVPTTGSCFVLITSRYSNWPVSFINVPVDVLSQPDAERLLQIHTRRELAGEELVACGALAKKLGCLPLALEQAAAYIEQQGDGFGFVDYLQLYEIAYQDLLAKGALGSTEYQDAVITTWKPTITKLTPGARTLLRIVSFFESTPIPEKIIIQGASLLRQLTMKYASSSGPEPGNPELWVRDALAQLKAYSLIKKEGDAYYLHPLLQVVEQLNNEDGLKEEFIEHAILLFTTTRPPAFWREDCRKDWNEANEKLWKLLLPHGEALLKLKAEKDPALLSTVGNAYASTWELEKALSHCKEAYELASRDLNIPQGVVNEYHEDVGYLLRQTDKPEEGHAVFQEIFDLRLSELGMEDRLTLRALHNIAITEKEMDQFEPAIDKMKQVTAIRERVYGSEDYDTLTSVHDLGWAYAGRHQNEEAIRLYQQALAVWEKSLDPNNPDILTAFINMAIALEELKRYDDAIAYCQRAVDMSTKAHAIYSKYTRRSIQLMSELLYRKEDYVQAETYYRQYIDLYVRSHGPEHPATLRARREIVNTLIQLNKMEEAEAVLENLIAVHARISSSSGEMKLMSIRDLGSLYEIKGEPERAMALYAESLERNILTGIEYETARKFITHWVDILDKLQRSQESNAVWERGLQQMVKNANGHPLDQRNIARDYFVLGKYKEAEELLRHLVSLQFEMGSTHCHLARIMLLTGREAEARTEVKLAKEAEKDMGSYIAMRILFFELLFALLDQQTPGEKLQLLHQGLKSDTAFSDWTIQPVIDHLAPRLTSTQVQMMRDVAQALCKRENAQMLDVWVG